MTDGTTSAARRFALDKPRARNWLGGGAGPHAEDPGIRGAWNPRSFQQEDTVYLLVRCAVDAEIISCPAGGDLDFDYAHNRDGGSCRFLVGVEDGHLELVSPDRRMRRIGEHGTAGIPAALAVLDEAVRSANSVLDSLNAVAPRLSARVPADARSADSQPAGTRDQPASRLAAGPRPRTR